MIKVGDKFTYKEHEWTVIDLDNFQDTLEAKDEDGNERYFMQSKAYKNWYEQQKQRADELEDRISEEIRKRFQLEDRWRKAYERADELEKRWSEMRKYLEERIETSKVDCGDNKYIYSRYKTCKNALFKMQRLQEDDNA